MYSVDQHHIKKGDELYEYFDGISRLCKPLYNVALFVLRQNFTAQGKTELSANEAGVMEELTKVKGYRPGILVPYEVLDRYMRETKNRDYFAKGLPSQTKNEVLKAAVHDFEAWLDALKAFKSRPQDFTGKPRMPRYKKNPRANIRFSNQQAIFRGTELKLPFTDTRLRTRKHAGTLKIAEAVLRADSFDVVLVFEEPDAKVTPPGGHVAAVDFGVDNLLSAVTDNGESIVFKGGAVKARNQWFNKQKAYLTSRIQKETGTKHPSSKTLEILSENRRMFMSDTMHKTACRFLEWCDSHEVGTIVLGRTKFWKQETNIGKANNQNFVSIPFYRLQEKIKEKAALYGIVVIEQEESYTSQSSFLDNDDIPVYGKTGAKAPAFSGNRIKRGLYRAGDKTIVNADLNAAANIMRKAGFDTRNISVRGLQNPQIVRYKDLNTCIPVKGIAAA